jgi:hypothetical protein
MTRTAGLIAVIVSLAAAAAASAVATGAPLRLGPASGGTQPVFQGYYDGHKDAYLITDVSSKSQASALHVNYSKSLGSVRNLPAQYFIQGRAAARQLAVFGSQPGEKDYNPLWIELFVTWKPGVKPVLLTSDNQINKLAAEHKLTLKNAHIVLNAPITKVGKKK